MSVNVKDILDALHQMQKSLECSICLELLKDPHSTKCNHQFCGGCIKQVFEKSSKKSKNKWYCPLCKTPVSKRSLTQNPRLNEIVVAVRNLQEAVHEDTGIPTGSPPSQNVVSTVRAPTLVHVLKDNPTPQGRKKSTCIGRVEGRNTSARSQMEEFSVFIANNDDTKQNHTEHQSQFVSNINIRSSIGPPTRINNKKSKTAAIAQTRRATRRTRRTVIEINEQAKSSENVSNDDLLHIIDNMPFQPISKDSSGHGQDSEQTATHHKQIPTTDKTLPDQTVEYDVPSGRNISKAYMEINNNANSDCDKSVFDKPICLTTIAEADSSVNTSLCENCSRVYDKRDHVCCSCVSVNRHLKGAVTSTVYDSTTQSTYSLDTMQSVSLLQSLDGQTAIVETVNGDMAGPFCQEEPSQITDQEHHGSLKPLYGQMVPVGDFGGGISGKLCKEESLQVTDQRNQGPLKQLYGQMALVDGQMSPKETVYGDIVADLRKEEPCQANDQKQQGLLKKLYGHMAPMDGQMAPVDGQMTPVDGQMTPVDGQMAPVDGQMAPVDGQMAPVDGQMTPVDGQMAPVDGQMTPVDGQMAPMDGQMAPLDGQMTPVDGQMTPVDGQMAPVDGQMTPVDGQMTPVDGQMTPVDGQMTPEETVYDDSCFGHTEKQEQKLDKVELNATTNLQQKADASPGYHERGQGVLYQGESEGTSDLCERVKLRQRHRTSDLLYSHQSSPNIMKLMKPKAKKRSLDSVVVEVSQEESARKKFRNSEGSHSQPHSSLTNTNCDESIKGIGLPAELEQNFNFAGSLPPEDGITELDNNEGLAFIESLSSDSDKATPTNEMVPASVSTSDSCYSSVINPMIPHTERQSQTAQIDTVTESTTERRLVLQKEANLEVCTLNRHEVASCPDVPSQNVLTKSASSQAATRVCTKEKTIAQRGESHEICLIQESTTVLSKSKPCQQNSWRSLSPTGDRLNAISDDTMNVVNQKGSQDEVNTSQNQTAQEFRQCQAFNSESKHSGNTGIIGPQNPGQGGLEKKALKRTALYEYGSTSVSQGLVPDPKTLQSSSRSHNVSQFENQGLIPDFNTLQPLIVGQNLLENTCNVGSHEDMGRIEQDMDKMISEVNEKKSIEELREDEKTAQSLSQKQTISEVHSTANTPTQSFVEMDVITPFLFGNDSPIRNESQKMVETEAGLTTPQKQIDSYDNNVASFKSDSRTSNLMGEVVHEKSTNGDHVQFNVSLESKNPSSEREGTKLDHGLQSFFITDQRSPDSVRNMSLEGKQEMSSSLEVGSCSTSQSISVLQDLEPLPTGNEVKLDGPCHAKDDEPSNEDMEPVPKKLGTYATPSAYPGLLDRTRPTSRRGTLTCSCEESLDTQSAESDVIPPTPPVKPVTEPVCTSRVQSPSLRISRSRKVRQMPERPISGSASAKPSKICKNPGPIEEIQSKHDEDEIEVLSVDTTRSEASNSLMKNHIAGLGNYNKLRSQKKFENITNRNHARLLQQSETASQMKRLENSLTAPSRQLSQSPRLSCVQRERFHGFSQISDNREVTEDELQSKISKPDAETPDEKFTDGVNCSSDHLKSLKIVACDNVKEVEDNGDSFRWTPCQGISEENGNNDDGKLGNTEKVKNDECNQVCLDHKNRSRGNYVNKHETGDRCDDKRRQGESQVGESPYVEVESDEGDSLGDEDLLTSVFLPKEANVDKDESDDEEDGDELTAFSQELISSQEEEHDDEIPSACKAMDSTGASSTFLSEGAASTQKMEVLRMDVEEMEREMAELRAYLAEAEETTENAGSGIQENGKNLQEEIKEHHEDEDIFPSLTPPPPLTPRRVPPMPTLSSPLKHMSHFLNQEGQSSDDDSDLAEMSGNGRKQCIPAELLHEGEKQNTIRCRHTVESPFTPGEDAGVTTTTVEHRQEETPSRTRTKRSQQSERDRDEMIILDDRDTVQSGAGSLLLVKRRKMTDDLIPRKSPVVSLLFTKSSKKGSDERGGRSSRSPRHILTKRDSSFTYSHAMCRTVSPIKAQSPADRESRDRCVSRGSRSIDLRAVTRIEDRSELQSSVCRNDRVALLSFVATRLNRRQLAEARGLAEQYGGKLASEFNSKTSHVILATDENMQVTRHSYTMKYLLGLALGKWIVSHHWITACIQAKQIVPENDYEVKGDQDLGQTAVPRLARMARITKKVLLFEDFDVLCVGTFNAAVTKEQLTQLLKSCGAHVFIEAGNLSGLRTIRRKVIVMDKQNSHDLAEIKDLCYQLKTSLVSLEWVTDSIANYRVQDFTDYIVNL